MTVVEPSGSQDVDDLGVADQLQDREPRGALDVVVAHGVLVALDRGDHDLVHLLDVGEARLDLLRPAEVECQRTDPVADLRSDSRRPLGVPTRDDDRLSTGREALGNGSADARCTPDDDRVALAQVQED